MTVDEYIEEYIEADYQKDLNIIRKYWRIKTLKMNMIREHKGYSGQWGLKELQEQDIWETEIKKN